jgi:hypothetical protein
MDLTFNTMKEEPAPRNKTEKTESKPKKWPIDNFRRSLMAEGLSWEAAAIATGMAASYAQDSYCAGYEKGYNDGYTARENRGN